MAVSPTSSLSLYQPDIEAQALALLLKHGGEIWGEFYLTDRQDWSEPHRPLWDIISLQLSSQPQGSLDPLLLSTKLAGAGVTTLQGGFLPFDYLEGLTNRYVEKGQASHYARELKRLRVRRDLLVKLDTAKKELLQQPNMSFTEMTGLMERELSAITTAYYKPEVTEVWGNLIQIVEDRAAKPLKPDEIGYLGPFKSINETVASLCYHGSYTVIASRSGGGKSSLGWYYQTYLLEKYESTFLLHLDAAEMSFDELCWRAVCALSNGAIPYHAVYSGDWAKNPSWVKLVRGDLWPRVMKMKDRMFFKNVGGMSTQERIAFIRRFYYQKVGRSRHLLVNDDYLKSVASDNRREQEYQTMGFYVGDQKTLITDEITASVWTGLQKNRTGITTGKKEEDIDDSEGSFSLSDRILQQSTHSFGLRFKVEEEMAREMNLFGNLKLTLLKKRQLLGKRYKEMLIPIKTDKGKFIADGFNLNVENFSYTDRGTFREMYMTLGKGKVDLGEGENQEAAAKPL